MKLPGKHTNTGRVLRAELSNTAVVHRKHNTSSEVEPLATDMTMEERILAALRGNPMSEAELGAVMRLMPVILRASWLRPMLGEGLIIQMTDGRLVRSDEHEQVIREVANG